MTEIEPANQRLHELAAQASLPVSPATRLNEMRDSLNSTSESIARLQQELGELAAEGNRNGKTAQVQADLTLMRQLHDRALAAVQVLTERIEREERERLASEEAKRLADAAAEKSRIFHERIGLAQALDEAAARLGALWRDLESNLRCSSRDVGRARLYALSLLGRGAPELVRTVKMPGSQHRFSKSSLVSLVSNTFSNSTGGSREEADRMQALAEQAEQPQVDPQPNEEGLIETLEES